MTIINYLTEKLTFLSKQFPYITIKYGYDNDIYRHIIELTPQKEYYHNFELDDAWISLSLNFMQQFPDECISFVSDDSTLKVNEPELVFNLLGLIPRSSASPLLVPLGSE